jgi:hypothetical protein
MEGDGELYVSEMGGRFHVDAFVGGCFEYGVGVGGWREMERDGEKGRDEDRHNMTTRRMLS